MRVMVTGGCGLVGSLAVRQLLELGHEPVAYDLALKTELLEDVRDGVIFVKGDVQHATDLLRAAQAHGVRRILHTASFLTPGAYERPYAAVQTNIMGALNVYETVRLLSLERGVFCSTGKVRNTARAHAQHVDDGNFGLEPDPYTSTKVMGELLLSDYRQLYDLDLVVSRFCGLVYGPGYAFSGAIGQGLQDLVEKPLRGEPVRVERVAHGPTVLAMLYARDAADGAVRATLAEGLTDWVFNISSPSTHVLPEIADTLRDLIPGAQIDVPAGAARGGPIEPDPRTREQLGYAPRYALADGLGEYVEFLRTARLRDWKLAAATAG
jgi:UDP-glucose 4-epimerase